MRNSASLIVAALLLSAPLPAAEPAASTPLPLDVVKAEFNLGKKYLAERKTDLAWLFFRNAVALERLTEPDEKGTRAKAMQAFVDKSMTLNTKVRHPCPVCVDREELARTVGKTRGLRAYFKKCPRCGTSKTVTKPGTVPQWRARMKSARKGYATIQAGRRMVQVGEAWVPKVHADKLSDERRDKLKQSLSASCEDCAGCGFIHCRVCSGIGEVKCRRCMMGIVSDRENKLLKTTVAHYRKCTVCSGIGGGFCSLCKGKGRITCKSCASQK